MKKDILIITGTPESNKATGEILHSVGIKWVDGDPANRFYRMDVNRTVRAHGMAAIRLEGMGEVRSGSMVIYHHSELTAEIVATFPNARPLVSEEKQTALDQLAQLEASAADLRETIDGMK